MNSWPGYEHFSAIRFEVLNLRCWNSSAEPMLPRGSPTWAVEYIDIVILNTCCKILGRTFGAINFVNVYVNI